MQTFIHSVTALICTFLIVKGKNFFSSIIVFTYILDIDLLWEDKPIPQKTLDLR